MLNLKHKDMEIIKELFIKSLGLFNSNKKHFTTMKNIFFKIIIIVLTFQIVKNIYNVKLDFSFELIFQNLFDKIGLVSLGIYLLLFSFFQALINSILPNLFIQKEIENDKNIIESKIKYLINNDSITEKLINSDPSVVICRKNKIIAKKTQNKQ